MNNKAVAVLGAVAVVGLVVVVWLRPSSQSSATEMAARLARGEDPEDGAEDVASEVADKPTRSAGSGSVGSSRLSTDGNSDAAEASEQTDGDEAAVESKKRSRRPRSGRKATEADSERGAADEDSQASDREIRPSGKKIRRPGG